MTQTKYLYMKYFIYAFISTSFISGCATSKTSTFKVGKTTHPINILAMSPGGGLLARAILGELANRGFTVVDAATVSSLSKSNLRKIDAHILVEATNGYDGNPNNASVTMKSSKTGQMIAGLSWQNGRGGAIGSPADRDMRKSAIEAAEEITEVLFKGIPSPSTPFAGITQKKESLSSSKESSSQPQKQQPREQQPSQKQQSIPGGGTGFMFSSKDYIITNYHVVKGANSIEVKFPDGEIIEASVQAKDSQNDIAVLKLAQSPSTELPDLQFGDSSKVRAGDKVFTIGYPASSILGKNQKITDGIISSVTGIEDDPTMFQITVPIQPGNSGGPLFNEQGEVIGITTASLSFNAIQSLGALPQNINYAVKSSFVKNLLSSIPKTLLSNRGIVVVPNKPGNSLSDFFERVSNNIVLIEAK